MRVTNTARQTDSAAEVRATVGEMVGDVGSISKYESEQLRKILYALAEAIGKQEVGVRPGMIMSLAMTLWSMVAVSMEDNGTKATADAILALLKDEPANDA